MGLVRSFIGCAVLPVVCFAVAQVVVRFMFRLSLRGDLNRPVPAFWVALLQTIGGGALLLVVKDAFGLYGGYAYVIIATLAFRSALANHPSDTGDPALNVPLHTAAMGTVLGVIVGYSVFR
jgi:hypothetical protein